MGIEDKSKQDKRSEAYYQSLAMVQKNALRNEAVHSGGFDAISGKDAPLERFEFKIAELHWWLPTAMKSVKIVRDLLRCGSVKKYCAECRMDGKEALIMETLLLARIKEDFTFWAASFVTIKDKQTGKDVHFNLNNPQKLVLGKLEEMRLANKPIRMIILKARQWGGSTLVQIYMAWIQLVHKQGWYSAIVAHQSVSALNIRAMYQRMLRYYPPSLLGLPPKPKLQLTPYGGSRGDVTISQNKQQVRDTVISIGSMQSPDSIAGHDIALVHFSEVGLWKATDGKSPEDVIQTISSAILEAPLTMDVMESTARGENNLFHHEWLDAKKKDSKRVPVFIPWFQIELYSEPFGSEKERLDFARRLWRNRENTKSVSARTEPGAYLWSLWDKGATLEAINWYIRKRQTYRSHDAMASEFPSDDVEAFAHSGQRIFDQYKVEQLRKSCCAPLWVGEVVGDAPTGAAALRNTHFTDDAQGDFRVWEMPDSTPMTDRYLVSTDIGGRSEKADFSVVVVIDRAGRINGEGDAIVAEWHGHCRHDALAWKMAQIAQFYNQALLVVESNTLETKDNDTEGSHSLFILDQIGMVYRNLYSRESTPDKIRQGRRRMWGFHTNTATKQPIIDHLQTLIDDCAYTEREEGALEEYNVYQRTDRGTMEAAEGYHDDRLMARAIGLYISNKMPMPRLGVRQVGASAASFNLQSGGSTVNESVF